MHSYVVSSGMQFSYSAAVTYSDPGSHVVHHTRTPPPPVPGYDPVQGTAVPDTSRVGTIEEVQGENSIG